MSDAEPSVPTLSIVVPAHDEEANVATLVREIGSVLGAALEPGEDHEVIVVDDGSLDSTWREICALGERDPRIKGVRLSRNFGHQYALLAGLSHARGRAVVTLDADLKHPPSVIPALLNDWRAGARIVHTLRRDAADTSFLKRASARLFYRIFSFLSGVEIQPGMADFRLLDRQVVDALLEFKEEGLFLRGLVHWVGFPSTTVHYEAADRHAGTSSYTLRRMVRLAWTGVTSFSLVPLRLGIVLGLAMSALAFLELGFAVLAKLYWGTTVPGWASAISVLSLLFGVLFIFLGLLGEYLGRILVEVRRRPRFITAETSGLDEPTDRPPGPCGDGAD